MCTFMELFTVGCPLAMPWSHVSTVLPTAKSLVYTFIPEGSASPLLIKLDQSIIIHTPTSTHESPDKQIVE